MTFRETVQQAWAILWRYKYLAILGIALAVTTGAGSPAHLLRAVIFFDRQLSLNETSSPAPLPNPVPEGLPVPTVPAIPPNTNPETLVNLAIGLVVALLCIGLLMVVAAGIISLIATGSMIAGASDAYQNRQSHINAALNIGLRRAWKLLLVASIPPLPVLAGGIISVAATGLYLRSRVTSGDIEGMLFALTNAAGLRTALLYINILLLIAACLLVFLQTFAFRACVIEDMGAIDSFRHGWRMLRSHLPEALKLLLLQAAIQIGLLTLGVISNTIVVAGFLLGSVMAVLYGIARAFFANMWTLAYLDWNADA